MRWLCCWGFGRQCAAEKAEVAEDVLLKVARPLPGDVKEILMIGYLIALLR